MDGFQLMDLGRQSADFGLQLLLRLVHLLAELSKGRSHLPGNTEGRAWRWLVAKAEGAQLRLRTLFRASGREGPYCWT